MAVFHHILVRENGFDEDSRNTGKIQSEPGAVEAREEYGVLNITSELQTERAIE